MREFELKITPIDWLYIVLIGAVFGAFISSMIYFLTPSLHDISTIFFGVVSAINIAIFASVFISLSNNYILPKLKIRFWQLISFCFSFLAGIFGFGFNYFIFYGSHIPVLKVIEEHLLSLLILTGLMTFLIGFILHLFVSMKYKNESIEKNMLDSKIKALENELNPHFLFNALNSVSELVYQNPKKAEESILKLSKFLRNAINKASLVTLNDEIEMTQNYIDIENIRFSNMIELQNEISDTVLFNLVPKFSIQLLVENAIKHGYLGQKLTIKIANISNTIIVSNNGKIPHKLHYKTGLKNLSRRLQYLQIGKLEHEITPTQILFKIELL